jgi:hypothetical protein
MTTLTYCKGLPTPIDELNPIGNYSAWGVGD